MPHRPRVIPRSSPWRPSRPKEPITVRPADLLAPEWDSLVEQASALPGYDGTEEDVLTFALFPGVAPTFFEHRKEGPKSVFAPRTPDEGRGRRPGERSVRTDHLQRHRQRGQSHRFR